MNQPINTEEYFQQIGAWPDRSRNMTFSYITGFILSLCLTLAAYHAAVHHIFSERLVLILVVAFACIQFLVQVVCFLHMSAEQSSRARLAALGFAALIVAIIVGGSLWIMASLNERMMPTQAQMEQYMNGQQGI
jgi:cytochrome o ubiquinol oxidase operon protein cyoD